MNPQNTALSTIGDQCTGQSIVKIFQALDEFVGAVNHMHDVVMVPSRLKDIDTTAIESQQQQHQQHQQQAQCGLPSQQHSSVSLNNLTCSSSGGSTVSFNISSNNNNNNNNSSQQQFLQKGRHSRNPSDTSLHSIMGAQHQQQQPIPTDLFACYQLLDSVRKELVDGTASELDDADHHSSGAESGLEGEGSGGIHGLGSSTSSELYSLGSGCSAASTSSAAAMDSDGGDNISLMSTASDSNQSSSQQHMTDEQAKLSHTFRHHLNGLFGVMRQLTDQAHVISTEYVNQFERPL